MELASLIDHTLLKADMSLNDLEQLCSEAIQHQFVAVCIPPYYVKKAAEILQDSEVNIATVCGFPMGYNCTSAKVEEAKRAIDEGASEVDMVVNVNAVKNADWNYVKNDINSVSLIVQLKGGKIKVIFETALLDDDEIIKLCEICAEVGVDFVKTSTGFNGEGANERTIRLMRDHLPSNVHIKASGGIRNREDAMKMVEAGADRIGASRSIEIIG